MADEGSVSGRPPAPLTVLTGFLGAGKTTLLNRILNGDHGLRVGVLVNNFGSVNIDADLVVGVDSDVISLANGCVCCSIRDDLVEAVKQTLDRPECPEYLLLEASGVAEPSGIAMTFVEDASIRDRVRLDSIMCVVDAEQVFSAPELMETKIWQIAFSDLVVLNKVDLVNRARIDEIRAWLDSRFHRYRLIEATRCDVPLEILLGVGRFDPARLAPDAPVLVEDDGQGPHRGHQHHRRNQQPGSFDTWSYQSDVPMMLDVLRDAAARLPTGVYRAKGVVYSADAPARRAVLHVVGKRVDVSLGDPWGERPRRTQIVVIGATDSIDGPDLRAAFDAAHGQLASTEGDRYG